MMNKLRILDNLRIFERREDAAVAGRLVCDCGGENFSVSHSGKQSRGILCPDILPLNGQLTIEARCSLCKRAICIYDSMRDGKNAGGERSASALRPLTVKGADSFALDMYFNFDRENFLTNAFTDCIIEAGSPIWKKKRIFFE